ncbi:hypothetical protein HY641_05270 [Candidatus Woesearchaeota archaeon]|nr:hypothetical protein [Candidatus Woesearchaeota archaeon]
MRIAVTTIIMSLLLVATALAQAPRNGVAVNLAPSAGPLEPAMTYAPEPVPVAKPRRAPYRTDYSLTSQMIARGQGRIPGSSKLRDRPYRKELYSQEKSAIGTAAYRPSGARNLVKTTCKLGISAFAC